MRTRVSGPGGGRCALIISSVMKPVEYFQSAGGRSRVYQRLLKRSPCLAWRSSSMSRTRMSPSVWLAYRRLTSVLSDGSRRIAAITWSMGVMPVPPAIIPMRFTCFSLEPTLKWPWPLYSFMPHGPEMVILSPTCMRPRCWDILPPSGKRSILPPSYTLMTRSQKPMSWSEEVGVYLRSISVSSFSSSSRPFHSPLTFPCGLGA
mmetsp:Transcript_19501/g.65459  ORF Transcript_19501/g.65459 Transcript_19501/m.65459 type:complete len:204 (+) Transcript_19501:582-1193(+)